MSADPLPALTAALVAAHRAGGAAHPDVASLPRDIAQGYGVQAAVAHTLGAAVAGWKAGFGPGGEAVAAPLLSALVRESGARFALPRARTVTVEVEIGLRLARDLPRRARDYERDEILAAVDEAVVGIELVSGRVGEAKDVPFPLFLADNLGNFGYVRGSATRSFRLLDLDSLRCRLLVDGRAVHEAAGGHPQRDPVEPLRAWASRQADELGGLRAGQLVTTGALALVRLTEPAEVSGDIEGIGTVALGLKVER